MMSQFFGGNIWEESWSTLEPGPVLKLSHNYPRHTVGMLFSIYATFQRLGTQ